MRTPVAYSNGSSNMACAWTTRNAPSEGVRSTSMDRFSAITESRPSKPESVSEVKSLLGMAHYVSRYIPDYFTITVSLRLVTMKDAPWQWTDQQQRTFDKLKDSLTKNHMMSYFSPRLKTEVIVDASTVGLEGLLVQDGKVISYASWALSDVESRYSQTERETLGVVWAVEHSHLYLYGSEFIIATDQKPLLGIFNGHKPTLARIDRWKLRLMPYNCQLIYRLGKDAENPADFMSSTTSKYAQYCRRLRELCMQSGHAKSRKLQEYQVRDGEGHFAPGTDQGHWD